MNKRRKPADVVQDLPPIQAVAGARADWDEIERVAALEPIAGATVHNTFVHICRALVEMTAK